MFLIYLIMQIFAIFLVIYIHEFTKAFTSYKLGDKGLNPYKNPLSYIDVFGFLSFLFLGYGWGNPPETSALNYKNRKLGTLLTYLMPILINFILSFIFLFLSFLIPFSDIFIFISEYSLKIAIFSLLPIYPLCGQKLLLTLLAPDKAFKYEQIEKYIRLLLLIMLLSGYLGSFLNIIFNFIFSAFAFIFFL